MLSEHLRRIVAMAGAICIWLCVHSLAQADEIKVGLLNQSSGAYSWWGQEYKRGVDMFLAENGSKVGPHTVQVLERDVGGNTPQRAKQLAQELVVRDQVQYLIGGTFTPEVLAVVDVANQSKTPLLIFNSGTSMVTDKSPYFVRVGFTQWAVSVPLVQWALAQGAKNAALVVADYAPGQDALDAYGSTFTAGGGKIVGEVKVPLGTTDFSSYLQRVKDLSPQYVFMFMPVGPMSAGFIKSFKERGLDKSGITLLATTETQESDLPAVGDSAIGLTTALHYSPFLDNAANQKLVKAWKAKYGPAELPSHAAIAAYDGMRVVFEMIKATDGKRDGDKAMAAIKGLKWDSPRGPVSIDGNTREIVQNVYIRRVEKIDGVLGNKPIKTYEAVKDPWHERKQ
jgi:branched-chain amino acid transport system substrate-binding protein